MIRLITLFFVFAWMFLNGPVYSQNSNTDSSFTDSSSIKEAPKRPVLTNKPRDRFLSNDELNLSYIVLIFATVVLLFEVFLVSINKISLENSFKFIIVTLIIACSLFLITAGYDNNQIAPAFGLFGTIAGYILGKTNSQETKKEQDEKKNN
jgi:glycerol uptake facilitator-like aquaporin